MWLFYYFNFERNYEGILKSKTPCILLDKNINFNKNETESKIEKPTQSFRETNPLKVKNRKLNVKLWWIGARKRKKEGIFCTTYFIFFNIFICILSQCIVCWIDFQNILTFTHQKTLLYTLSCLFLKSSKALSGSSKFSDSLFAVNHPPSFSSSSFTIKTMFLHRETRKKYLCR